MPPPPPLKDVLDALQQCVLPAAGPAALTLAAVLAVGRWRGAALGSAAAVVVAFLCANFTLTNLRADQPVPTWENTSRLLLWVPGPDAPGYQWLPRAALLLVGAGLLTRWLGLGLNRVLPDRVWWVANAVVWGPRVWALVAVSGWLVLGNAAADPKWAALRWELVGTMLLVWVAADGLARGPAVAVPGPAVGAEPPVPVNGLAWAGAGAEASVYLAATFFAGAAVLLYSHNAKFMELAVVLGAALFGIAVVTLVPGGEEGRRTLASGAIPAAVAFLPGLLLGTRPSHADNKVPALSFWLVTLAPVALGLFFIPRINRQNRWLLLALRAAIVLLPLLIAVLLAGQYEKLPYEEEAEW